MPRKKGSKDKKKRASGSGGARDGSGGAREGSGGAREGSGGAREGAGTRPGSSNRMLPTTASMKLVDEGIRVSRYEDNKEEALVLFEKATMVDPNNGKAFYLAAKHKWGISTKENDTITPLQYESCLALAKEAHRLGFNGALDIVMHFRLYRRCSGELIILDVSELISHYNEKSIRLSLVVSNLPENKGTTVSPEAMQASKAFYEYALVLMHTEDSLAALGAFERAVALNPDDAPTLCNMAITLGNLGRYSYAVACLKACLRRWPGLSNATHLLKTVQDFLAAESDIVQSILSGTVGQGVKEIAMVRETPYSLGEMFGTDIFYSVLMPVHIPVLLALYKLKSEQDSVDFVATRLLPTPFSLTVAQLAATFLLYGLLCAEVEDHDAALAAYEVCLRLEPGNVIARQSKEDSWLSRRFFKRAAEEGALEMADRRFEIAGRQFAMDCIVYRRCMEYHVDEGMRQYIAEHVLHEHFQQVTDPELLEVWALERRAREACGVDGSDEELTESSGEEGDEIWDDCSGGEEEAEESAGTLSEGDEIWEDCCECEEETCASEGMVDK